MQAANETLTARPPVEPSGDNPAMYIDVTYDRQTGHAEFTPSSSKPWLLGQGLKPTGRVTIRWKRGWRQAHLYFGLDRHLDLRGCRLDVDADETVLPAARPRLQLSFPTVGERQGVLITIDRPEALPFGFEYELHLEHDGQRVDHDPKIYNEGDDKHPI